MIEAGLWAWIESDEAFEAKDKTVARIFLAMLNRHNEEAAALADHRAPSH
jgi:hypothetical protein